MTSRPRLPTLHDVCREVIADLAVATTAPTAEAVFDAARARIGPGGTIPALVLTQRVTGVVAAYFRHSTPGPGWRFSGRDQYLKPGTTALTWTDASGRVIADAVLAVEEPSNAVVTQLAARLHQRSWDAHGSRLALVRVLVPRTPARSRLLIPEGAP